MILTRGTTTFGGRVRYPLHGVAYFTKLIVPPKTLPRLGFNSIIVFFFSSLVTICIYVRANIAGFWFVVSANLFRAFAVFAAALKGYGRAFFFFSPHRGNCVRDNLINFYIFIFFFLVAGPRLLTGLNLCTRPSVEPRAQTGFVLKMPTLITRVRVMRFRGRSTRRKLKNVRRGNADDIFPNRQVHVRRIHGTQFNCVYTCICIIFCA